MTRKTRTTNRQDAENGPLRRSHFARSLDVHKEYASGSRSLRPSKELVLSILPKPQLSLAAALLDGDFEHPGEKKAVSKEAKEYLA